MDERIEALRRETADIRAEMRALRQEIRASTAEARREISCVLKTCADERAQDLDAHREQDGTFRAQVRADVDAICRSCDSVRNWLIALCAAEVLGVAALILVMVATIVGK